MRAEGGPGTRALGTGDVADPTMIGRAEGRGALGTIVTALCSRVRVFARCRFGFENRIGLTSNVGSAGNEDVRFRRFASKSSSMFADQNVGSSGSSLPGI